LTEVCQAVFYAKLQFGIYSAEAIKEGTLKSALQEKKKSSDCTQLLKIELP